MGRSDLERLSREELIELVLRLQRPAKTSRLLSKAPATDPKERREHSKPGGAKPGHVGHSRAMREDPNAVVDSSPDCCSCCGTALHGDLPAEVVSESERVDPLAVAPVVTQHRRLAVRCPSCGARVIAPVPDEARGTPFGPQLNAVATYLKTFQALSEIAAGETFTNLDVGADLRLHCGYSRFAQNGPLSKFCLTKRFRLKTIMIKLTGRGPHDQTSAHISGLIYC